MESSVDTAGGERGQRYLWPVILKIVIDVAIPIGGYYALRALGVGQVLALCLTTVPPVAYFLYRKARGVRVDAFEVFLVSIILISNGATLLSANPRVFLSMDGWVGFGIAIACLISLRTRRPLVYLLIRSLLDNTPLRVKHRTDEWDALYEREEWFRRPWMVSTVVWAVLNIVSGTIRLGIAFYAPVDWAPMFLGLMTLEVVLFTQFWQSWYLKRNFRKHGGFVPDDPPPAADAVPGRASEPVSMPVSSPVPKPAVAHGAT